VKSTVERLSPTRVRINVEVPFDELKPDFDRAYRKMAQQVRIHREGAAVVGRGAGSLLELGQDLRLDLQALEPRALLGDPRLGVQTGLVDFPTERVDDRPPQVTLPLGGKGR